MRNAAASRLILSKFSESVVRATARETLEEAGGRVSLGLVFCSPDYRPHLEDFLEIVQIHGHVPMLAGCCGHGIIGTGAEAEMASGFSLLLLHLPQTKLHTVTLRGEDVEDWDDAAFFREHTGGFEADAWIMLGDAGEVPAEPWVGAWNRAFPGVPCIGGFASAGRDDAFVFRDRELISGGVAIGLSGGVEIFTLVSQGCRPIGEALPVTSVEHNVIHQIGSSPAFDVLNRAYLAMGTREQERAKGNIFVGIAMAEEREKFRRGDFLIRSIIGADEKTGAVAVGAFPRVGQTVQYQMRDALAADEDLRAAAGLLAADGIRPFASLMFSCAGRGRHLFSTVNHDASVLAEYFKPHPSAGAFCNGEIGPVAGRNYVHGYTVCAALFV